MQAYKENHKRPKKDKDRVKSENFLEKKFKNRLEAVQYEIEQKLLVGMTEEEEKEQARMKAMFEKKMLKASGPDDKEERTSKPKNFKPDRGSKSKY